MKKLNTPILSTAFTNQGKKAKNRLDNILSRNKRRSLFLILILVIAMFSAEFMISCSNKKSDVSSPEAITYPLTEENAKELLRQELITAYENTYGEYSPLYEDPSPCEDREYLRYAIANLTLSEEDERFFKYPVIFEFYVEKETGNIYKYYNGIDETLTLFDPYSDTALAFAG